MPDRGELLGEGGRLGGKWDHSVPLRPELLGAPTTFIGRGISGGETLSEVASGVDLAPTCLSAVRRGTGHIDGVGLWVETPDEDRRVRSNIWQRYSALGREFPVYVASGLWDNDGDWVRHRRSRLLRMAYYGYDVPLDNHVPPARSTTRISELVPGLKFWGKDWEKFRNMMVSLQEAQKELSDELVRGEDSTELSEEQTEHLEALGYM